MILYDLLCSRDHGFEGWFRSSDTFDSQIAAGEIACPVCGSTEIRKAPSAPALVKGRAGGSDAIAVRLRQAMNEIRRQVEANCDYVGGQFPEEARRIHYGETKERPIYGEATPDDARELSEEGIEIVAIPWPSRRES